jgi:hypothetical protein
MQDIDNKVLPDEQTQPEVEETPEERSHREWREQRANRPVRKSNIHYPPELVEQIRQIEANQELSPKERMEAIVSAKIESRRNDPSFVYHDPVEALANLLPPVAPEDFDEFFGRYEDGTIYVKRLLG